MGRSTIIAGNWKMHKTLSETKDFVEKLAPLVEDSQDNLWLSLPFTSIATATEAVKGTNLVVGAQNMHDESKGAFTGEISAPMLVAAGASFVILGHSERRALFNEESEWIARKVKRALSHGLKPLVCIGETLEERSHNKMEAVLEEQLYKSLEGVEAKDFSRIALAYEPVWAIGTGKTATPEMAQEVHQYIRHLLRRQWGKEVCLQTPILYGGSVKPENARKLLACGDIDGVLVGGASLDVDSFSAIIHYNTTQKVR